MLFDIRAHRTLAFEGNSHPWFCYWTLRAVAPWVIQGTRSDRRNWERPQCLLPGNKRQWPCSCRRWVTVVVGTRVWRCLIGTQEGPKGRTTSQIHTVADSTAHDQVWHKPCDLPKRRGPTMPVRDRKKSRLQLHYCNGLSLKESTPQ